MRTMLPNDEEQLIQQHAQDIARDHRIYGYILIIGDHQIYGHILITGHEEGNRQLEKRRGRRRCANFR